MNIRFYNATILTLENGTNLQKGEVWIFDNLIGYVGKSQTNNIKWDREINLAGNLIMPGFKNAHTHSAMTFLRSYADDLPLNQWLNEKVFPMEAKLNDDYIYVFSKIGIMEYLTSGITSNFDMYISPAPVIQASIDCGFRTVMTGGLNNFTQSIEEIDECYKKYNGYNELISYELGFHAEYTCSRELLEGMADLAKKHHAPVFCHNSETQKEVEECIQRYGTTPTLFLDRLGIFNYGGGGYHCVHMTEDDIAVFIKHNLSVVTNPGSNMKLASGIAPISKFMKNNINIAIGTDGPASNNCLDMFREMFLTTGLAKLYQKDASAVDADEVLKMATLGGSKAMGLHNCDTLSRGKNADLIVIDLNQPNMQPVNNITKNIVYSGSKNNVILTMISGKILYENGKFDIGEEPEKIFKTANEILKKLKSEG
ncbi:MAG: amidohydrolase [Eubacterium sp.]